MNATVIVALITALAAILSPVLTSFLNNRHQEKMKEIEVYQVKCIQSIESYVKSAGELLGTFTTNSRTDYAKSKNEVLLYTPESTWVLMDELDKEINTQNYQSARETLNAICKTLSKSIQIDKEPNKSKNHKNDPNNI